MSKQGHFEKATWNACCDICGFAFKFTELRKAWDGSYRCQADWETRQPQDFVRAVRDNPSVPVARPQNIIYLVNADNIFSEYVLDGETLG